MSAVVEMPVTMTSLELVDFINNHRAESGEPRLTHANFIAKVLKVLGETSHLFECDLPDSYGRPRKGYRFPKRESCLMAMSYSYELQAAVFDHMTALESKLNQQSAATLPTYSEALRQLADQIDENTRISAERDHAIATKAQIGSKREASAMAKASALSRENNALLEELGRNQKHATVIAVERASGRKLPKTAYVPLRRWCKAHGVEANDVPDERHGSVKAWPAGAWLEAHGIDLVELFTARGCE